MSFKDHADSSRVPAHVVDITRAVAVLSLLIYCDKDSHLKQSIVGCFMFVKLAL